MNSATVALMGLAWLIFAYVVYGKLIEKKLIKPDDSVRLPAHRLRDGVDFYPARPLVLFGHHFASIAGAGPILGPVIAVAAFGYGLPLIWILVGVVLVGAVHDYTTAMLSVRNDGKSIPDITGGLVGGHGAGAFPDLRVDHFDLRHRRVRHRGQEDPHRGSPGCDPCVWTHPPGHGLWMVVK